MGVYPMLLDETCFFLAVDFDKQSWREDAAAFMETCSSLEVAAVLERSRSGNGGHVWLFFQEPIAAALARKLASHILTETMERRPDIGLDSYDRLIPSQDTLPNGGFGNLIALPLQKKPRSAGNSLFLDETFVPHGDQWAFLATVKKISLAHVDAIVHRAEDRDRILGVCRVLAEPEEGAPWFLPPSRRKKEEAVVDPPERLDLILADQIYIPKEDLSTSLCNRLIRMASFQNPEFYKAQAMRLPTHGKPRIICCAEEYPRHIALPRGCIKEVEGFLRRSKIALKIEDERFAGTMLPATFLGKLDVWQLGAARALVAHDTGVLSAPTAFGKTVIAAWLIAQRGVNTLVIVHRQQLMEQWMERLAAFLDLPDDTLGKIGGGRRQPSGRLDVAIIQSLTRKGVVDDLVADYGHIIIDECHHVSAVSFERVARRAKAKFVTGLSATVARKDGHHPIVFMQCGPIRYCGDPKVDARIRPFDHSVVVRPTSFESLSDNQEDAAVPLHQLYQEMIVDDARNHMICEDVVASLDEGRSPLLLTERVAHLELLAETLGDSVEHLIVLRGGLGRKKLQSALAELAEVPRKESRLIVATGRFIGEGFDDSRLDTLFLTLPVSWRGIVAQYAGRLHRLHDGKREVRIYDYADLNVSMLARMFERRCRGYEALGYRVQLPASAVAQWPAGVGLPADPLWKKDYAASVRRLIRDGVDRPLAELFNEAAREISSEVQGADRARSASEAFLYHRLNSLANLTGRFRLNVALPIPFDAMAKMEVDLLDAQSAIVIEIDGPQHMSDPNAYRRDRRKDQLLQENGYLVLRFLAEDVGKRLNEVLDAIARACANRDK